MTMPNREQLVQALVVVLMVAGIAVFAFAEHSLVRLAGIAGAILLGLSLFLPGRYTGGEGGE